MAQLSILSRGVRSAVLAVATCVTAGVSAAQTTQRIDASQPTCKGCSLTFTKVATLGNKDDPEFAGTAQISTGLAVDSKGRFFATELAGNRILAYAPDGKFLNAFGVTGDGPGEFRRAMKITVDAGDSVHVLSALRVITYSPQFKVVRAATLPVEGVMPTAPLVMKDGEFVFSGMPLRKGGFPYFRLPANGTLTGFGTWTDSVRACSLCARQTLASSTRAGEFWSMFANVYAIHQWGADGRAMRTLTVVNSPWFTPWGKADGTGGPGIKPKTTFMELLQDRAGLLWVEGHGPIANWTPSPNLQPTNVRGERGAANIPIGGGKVPSAETLKRHVTYIDVFDPAAGKLFLSQSFTGRQLRMISAQHFAELREDDDGIPVWDVFKVAIKKP